MSAAQGASVDSSNQVTDVLQWFSDGGPVLVILAALSVIALTLVLLKIWQFHRLRLDAAEPLASALGLWAWGQSAAAVAAVADAPQPAARLLHRALTGYLQPGVDLGLLREELARFANAEIEGLRAYLRALETIATLSPLLGLLGTVFGMIEAFQQLEQAGARVDPALLSGGIWQALLTTAAGLGVAIPVVFAHAWLEQRVERCGYRMEDAVTRVFTRDLARAGASGMSQSTPGDASQPASGTMSQPTPDDRAQGRETDAV
ncbi:MULTISPECIES: MotA/TolQ/ExbB proton channel family protein [Thiorhodovibrio]|uniref:MotA/TolQ/ExbB proton channel family protein n=1 Tax=Thiorhodovibrio TaxID=61593 RepID=UPI001914B352|nr:MULTISPECIES: MotA/TolQ/ExbB proton channel family protein [Thiorhodovibrio]MBK5968094.1 flagellar motor protein MotA [Thiorhodovibrio winogradskyi]WPL12684.1 colicin uptake protein TolQ [Thiorhodovibrio litoralis]